MPRNKRSMLFELFEATGLSRHNVCFYLTVHFRGVQIARCQTLSPFRQQNVLLVCACILHRSQSLSLLLSIEFDRDCDYFAIAGVTKKIKVYEYGTVIQDAVDIHYPENEMTCNSKIRYVSLLLQVPVFCALHQCLFHAVNKGLLPFISCWSVLVKGEWEM